LNDSKSAAFKILCSANYGRLIEGKISAVLDIAKFTSVVAIWPNKADFSPVNLHRGVLWSGRCAPIGIESRSVNPDPLL